LETTIYMVRHAESPYTPGEERTRGLSADGRAAAEKVADVLADENIDWIASSSYARAVDTVKPMADRLGLPVVLYEELVERLIKGPGREAEWPEIERAVERSFVEPDYALEGGETSRQARQRAVPVIERLLRDHRGKRIVIGTHGNIMTIILNHYDPDIGYAFWRSTSRPDIYRLTFGANGFIRMERMWAL